jgi:hypothetical protein
MALPHLEYPRLLYKDGLERRVYSDDELSAALAEGWRKTLHEPVAPAAPEPPKPRKGK